MMVGTQRVVLSLLSICVLTLFLFVNKYDTSIESTQKLTYMNYRSLKKSSQTFDPSGVVDMQSEYVLNYKEHNSLIPKRQRLLFSAPQKCAGRTIYELIEYISNHSNAKVHRSSIMNLEGAFPKSGTLNVSEVVPGVVRERIQTSLPLEFIYTHFSFVDFSGEDVHPTYISIVRDPFERLRSFYYFKRYGDTMLMTDQAKEWRLRIQQLNLSKDTYDDCVIEGREECVGQRARMELIRHFCGYSRRCYDKPENVLQIAKKNIERHYAAIGLTEEFEDFLKVLERFFPILFQSAIKHYSSNTFKEIVKTTRTNVKFPVLMETKDIMMSKLAYEYEIYYFIKQRFHQLKSAMFKRL